MVLANACGPCIGEILPSTSELDQTLIHHQVNGIAAMSRRVSPTRSSARTTATLPDVTMPTPQLTPSSPPPTWSLP
jgi:hypothetical protein